MTVRKVCVSFSSFAASVRKKCISLGYSLEVPDVVELRNLLHREMLLDESIKDLCGTKYTPVSDLLIFQYDFDFNEEIEMWSDIRLQHKEKNLVARLRGKQIQLPGKPTIILL